MLDSSYKSQSAFSLLICKLDDRSCKRFCPNHTLFLERRIFNSLYLFSDVKPRNFSFAFEEDNIKIEINKYENVEHISGPGSNFPPSPRA